MTSTTDPWANLPEPTPEGDPFYPTPVGDIADPGERDTLAALEESLDGADNPGVVLFRAGVGSAAVMYMAMHAADADALHIGGDYVELLPWDVLPDVQPYATAKLAGAPLRAALPLGLAKDGEWTLWDGPEPVPPVPAS